MSWGTLRSSARSVMATAKTPSLNASMRPVSLVSSDGVPPMLTCPLLSLASSRTSPALRGPGVDEWEWRPAHTTPPRHPLSTRPAVSPGSIPGGVGRRHLRVHDVLGPALQKRQHVVYGDIQLLLCRFAAIEAGMGSEEHIFQAQQGMA